MEVSIRCRDVLNLLGLSHWTGGVMSIFQMGCWWATVSMWHVLKAICQVTLCIQQAGAEGFLRKHAPLPGQKELSFPLAAVHPSFL